MIDNLLLTLQTGFSTMPESQISQSQQHSAWPGKLFGVRMTNAKQFDCSIMAGNQKSLVSIITGLGGNAIVELKDVVNLGIFLIEPLKS